MKKSVYSIAAVFALAVGGNAASFEPDDAAPGQDKVEECRALFEEFGGDQPFGDCVQFFSGGKSPASTCRILIFLEIIPEEEYDRCVVDLSKR